VFVARSVAAPVPQPTLAVSPTKNNLAMGELSPRPTPRSPFPEFLSFVKTFVVCVNFWVGARFLSLDFRAHPPPLPNAFFSPSLFWFEVVLVNLELFSALWGPAYLATLLCTRVCVFLFLLQPRFSTFPLGPSCVCTPLRPFTLFCLPSFNWSVPPATIIPLLTPRQFRLGPSSPALPGLPYAKLLLESFLRIGGFPFLDYLSTRRSQAASS